MANFTFKGIKLTPEGQKYIKEINEMVDSTIEVGFHEDSGGYENGMTVASVAALNEFGASHMPARPFMKQSFESHEDELMDICEKGTALIANGGTAERALKQIGVFAKGLIQDVIASGDFAPNAPSTIKKKGSAQPLIDSGHMRQSVNYKIKKG